MIGNIQVLRAFAASGVVIYHTSALIFGVHTEFYGVALFFVLSGYLMCRIRNRSAIQFATDRFWRIVPSYWLVMTLLFIFSPNRPLWPLEHTLLSALFIPHDSPTGLHPILGVGWTLNMEMYFYLIFTLSILVARSFAPLLSTVVISLIWFGLPFITENKAALHYFRNAYIWFFVTGIGIWYATEWLKGKNFKFTLPYYILPISIAIYAISVVFFHVNSFAPALLFFLAILAANYGADIKNNFFILLGNASYPCYLLHTLLIGFLRKIGFDSDSYGMLLFTIVVFVGSWSSAIVWHLYVEKYIIMLAKRNVRIPMKAV